MCHMTMVWTCGETKHGQVGKILQGMNVSAKEATGWLPKIVVEKSELQTRLERMQEIIQPGDSLSQYRNMISTPVT